MKQALIFSVFLILLVGCNVKTNFEASQKSESTQDINNILGKWEVEKQYSWNEETNQWDPGLVLEDGTITENVKASGSPVYNEFTLGGPNCPRGNPAKYVTITPTDECYLIKGNILERTPGGGFNISVSHEWQLKEGKLEFVTTIQDPDKVLFETGFEKSKTISSRIE
ncbi:hypothetical protein HZA97_03735 [Candidatus Woesearchaeota archaeon]|nr:hypothetical protein [Candidatus Woesearchaeota archaeon]